MNIKTKSKTETKALVKKILLVLNVFKIQLGACPIRKRLWARISLHASLFITSIEALSKDKFSLYKKMYFTLLYFETCILSLQDIRFVYTKVSHPSNCEVYF